MIQSLTWVGLSTGERRNVKPWAPKQWRLTVSHGHRPHIRDSGKEYLHVDGELVRRGPRDKRALPFLFQENIQHLNSSALTKQPGNKKTQKPNNRNDQAVKTRHFLTFSHESFT